MTEQDNPSLPEPLQPQAPQTGNGEAGAPQTVEPEASKTISTHTWVALGLSALALLVAGLLWFSMRQQFNSMETTLSERLEQFGAANQQSMAIAKTTENRSLENAARVALLEQKLAESRDQQEALQTLYVELANNREERLITEVEQLMVIANQQLQLAGNIKPALLALQTADSRLQQLDTPQVIQLRKTIASDIQRLQSLPLVDTIGMSLKLDNIAGHIDKLPLVSERHPATDKAVAPDWDSSPMRRLVQEIWQDLRQMIRLERVDRPEPPLLAPDQHFFLRENLRLRLLTARIALLQHDEENYRTDLKAAEQWLQGYFDVRDSAVQNALAALKELSAGNIKLEIPDINESLGLVSRYKLTLERGSTDDARQPQKKNGPAS